MYGIFKCELSDPVNAINPSTYWFSLKLSGNDKLIVTSLVEFAGTTIFSLGVSEAPSIFFSNKTPVFGSVSEVYTSENLPFSFKPYSMSLLVRFVNLIVNWCWRSWKSFNSTPG